MRTAIVALAGALFALPSCGFPTGGHIVSGSIATMAAAKADPLAAAGPYSLTFSGAGFTANDNQTVHAVVLDNNAPVVRADATIEAGEFAFEWHGVLKPADTYVVDYYVDVNNNGTCDPSPTDQTWQAPVQPATADQYVQVQDNKAYVAVCANFPKNSI